MPESIINTEFSPNAIFLTIEDLGERLHETIFPQYTLKTVSEKRAEFYKYIIENERIKR